MLREKLRNSMFAMDYDCAKAVIIPLTVCAVRHCRIAARDAQCCGNTSAEENHISGEAMLEGMDVRTPSSED